MSIQSEINRINSEVSNQSNLIKQIETALTGKVVVGGTIVDTADATATEEDILEGVTAYVNGRKVTGKHVCESAGVEIIDTTTKLSSNSTSISFTGLPAEPKMFVIIPTANITLGATRYITNVIYDGSTTNGSAGYRSGSSAFNYYYDSAYSWTYENGTLTVEASSSTNGGSFSSSVTYRLMYVK